MGMEAGIDYKEYLSIIYGEDIDDMQVIFDKYIFIPSDKSRDANSGTKSKIGNASGRLLYTNGNKVITEEIDSVIPVIDGDTLGYIIFLAGDLKEIYKVKAGETLTKQEAMIVENGSFVKVEVTYKYYNKKHPEIIIEHKNLKYIGKFHENKLVRFNRIGR